MKQYLLGFYYIKDTQTFTCFVKFKNSISVEQRNKFIENFKVTGLNRIPSDSLVVVRTDYIPNLNFPCFDRIPKNLSVYTLKNVNTKLIADILDDISNNDTESWIYYNSVPVCTFVPKLCGNLSDYELISTPNSLTYMFKSQQMVLFEKSVRHKAVDFYECFSVDLQKNLCVHNVKYIKNDIIQEEIYKFNAKSNSWDLYKQKSGQRIVGFQQ